MFFALLSSTLLNPFSAHLLYGGNRISINSSEPVLSTTIENEQIRVGFKKSTDTGYGLGILLRDKIIPSFQKWEVEPFLLGQYLPGENIRYSHILGGLQASYFDFRIGSWAFDSNIRFWINNLGGRFENESSYSIGNINLDYTIGFAWGENRSDFWFPTEERTPFNRLKQVRSIGSKSDRQTTFKVSGGRRLSLGEENLNWNQGVFLNYSDKKSVFGLLTNLSYKNCSLSILIEESSLSTWLLELSGKHLTLGAISSVKNSGKHGIILGYHGITPIQLELIQERGQQEVTFNLEVEW